MSDNSTLSDRAAVERVAHTLQAPVAWKVTPEFATTAAVWGAAMGLFDAALRARPGGVAVLGWKPLVHAFSGSAVSVGITWALALVAAMVVHETGHAVAASRLGASRISVVLAGLHGRMSYDIDDPWSARRAVIVAAGAFAPAMFVPLLFVPHLAAFGVVGGAMVMLNVLPAPMSDGGHLVAVATHRLLRDDDAAAGAALALDLGILGTTFLAGWTFHLDWLFVLSAPLLVLALWVLLSERLGTQGAPEGA